MISSMTGFGYSEEKTKNGTFIWEIKSVNHRFLESYFRIPDNLKKIEIKLKDILKDNLSRGKVECSLKYISNIDPSINLINEPLAKLVVKNLETIVSYSNDQQKMVINPIDVLNWPGVLNDSSNIDEIQKGAIDSFLIAVNNLKETRKNEGLKLKEILFDKLEATTTEVTKIKKLMPNIIEWQKNKILKTFEELQLSINPERLEQEIILIAQKLDIAEEMDRLESHIKEAKNILNNSEYCGRKLDFLMQEFNRESNTIASKSINTEITNSAIELKVIIEQMREQIQNIE